MEKVSAPVMMTGSVPKILKGTLKEKLKAVSQEIQKVVLMVKKLISSQYIVKAVSLGKEIEDGSGMKTKNVPVHLK